MHRRQLKRVLLLAVFLAPELDAQLPPAPQKTPGVREESSDDPFGRSTPRGTVEGFIRAAEAEDYELAVSYLDTQLQGDLARELAQQLQAILNREASVDLHNLSTKPAAQSASQSRSGGCCADPIGERGTLGGARAARRQPTRLAFFSGYFAVRAGILREHG